MKNLVILAVAFALISVSVFSQKNPPEIVKKEFTQKYAAAKSVKWASESAKEWEAEFTLNGKEMSATFDNAGKWLETETEISSKELPAAVSTTLKTKFAGYKTGEMSILESPEMKGFEISLTKDKTGIEVVIDAGGKVLKNTPVEKEEKK